MRIMAPPDADGGSTPFRPSTLRLETVTNHDRCVIVVDGDVDASTAPQLRAVIEAALEGCSTMELDLQLLGFLDSTGLGVMAAALRALEPVQGRLELRAVPAAVRRLLEITDLAQHVHVLSHRP